MSQGAQVQQKRGRGRPRPSETMNRDEQILSLLRKQPMTRNQVSERLGLTVSVTYLSLSRLRSRGLVKLCQGPAADRLWSVDVDGPCP